jgi:diguanylate cyclase (GGDEF)-like protein/PAS domain S-box-containing protein
MPQTAIETEQAAEIERLKGRLQRLAEDKSYLQLIVRLIEQFKPLPGLHDMVAGMLHNIVETIGGTNIKIWYWIEGELHYADFLGESGIVPTIEDGLAEQVGKTREFVEQSGDVADSLLRGHVMPGTWTWCFPLLVGQELIGVVKLENVHIIGASLRTYLPIFFNHAALILSNEIRNHIRHKAESALLASEARFRRLIQVAPIPMAYVDKDGTILEFNDRFAKVFGYTRDDIPSLTEWWPLAYPDPDYRRWALETWDAAVAEAARLGCDIKPVEYHVTCKSGDVRIMEISGVILGEGFLATFIDQTERKQAEDRLRLAASVFAHSQEGIVIADADNRIVDVNDAFSNLTGYSRNEVIGKTPRILASGRHSRDFYEAMWRSLKSRSAWSGEIWNRRKNGQVYPEHLFINEVRDVAGNLVNYVATFTDISHVKAHEAELDQIAHFDSLTGLPNRRLLADRLELAIARAQRSGQILAVCYFDLDGFKQVNDQYGHAAGDQLLIKISVRLKGELRGDDTLSRLGGDEFVLLLNDSGSKETISQALDRMLAVISEPIQIENHILSVSASLGVTLFPLDEADVDGLLRHADQAMYRAKEAGRNRYSFYDSEQDRLVLAHHESLQRMAYALRDEEFVLYYQPKVHLVTGDVIGAEALIRWRHPDRGVLAPGAFLDTLDGTELEIVLGSWVIETALRQLAAWNAAGLGMTVSVNISPRHLQHPDFASELKRMLANHPEVDSKQLELEILESAAIADLDHASRILTACLALGVRFALDDFGTGYSSLAYFRRLPIETLKIDQAFVRDMLDDPEDLGIVESVIRLAQAFNRPVIAEGVETLEHGAMLVHMGCHYGQGYGIARPMPADLIPGWVEKWRSESAWHDLNLEKVKPDTVVLMVAGASHRKWINDVSDYLRDETGSFPMPLDSQHCRFGRWYQGSGASHYGHCPEFVALGGLHERIHALAEALLKRAGEHSRQEALAGLSDLFDLRDSLLGGLERLIAKVNE